VFLCIIWFLFGCQYIGLPEQSIAWMLERPVPEMTEICRVESQTLLTQSVGFGSQKGCITTNIKTYKDELRVKKNKTLKIS